MITSVGLPPTSGFIGKILVLDSITGFAGFAWYWAAILIASFCSLVAVSRALSVLLWNHADVVPDDAEAARPSQEHLLTPIQSRDGRAVGALVATAMVLALSIGLVVMAGPIKAQSDELAKQIINKDGYVDAVLRRSEGFSPVIRPSPAKRPDSNEASAGSGGSQ